MIIGGNIVFDTEEIDDDLINNLSLFIIQGNRAIIEKYKLIPEKTLLAELKILARIVKRQQTKIRGELYCVKDGVTGKYKGLDFEECEISVSTKRKSEPKKRLTEDDKVRLFQEYWGKKHKEPTKSEIYNEFRIGAWYGGIGKNKMLHEEIVEIMKK